MKRAGQVVLFRFPRVDLRGGKLRPALLLARLPGVYDDWLICMISTQLHQVVKGFDEIVDRHDPDFVDSGLKQPSVIRLGRLAVVSGDNLLGAIGAIAPERLNRLRQRLANWILNA